MKRSRTMPVVGLVSWMLALGIASSLALAADVTLMHVHGLSYSPDGQQLYIPSHHGLAVYSGGRWSIAPGLLHDYMGFASTKDTFYSSGHPAPGSGQTNPFGLMRSADGGKTWTKLGLEGEADFHLLATSYGTNTVYVFADAPNSRMDRPGLYVTSTDGRAWKRVEARGLEGVPLALAVHPTHPANVAVGTKRGLYFSGDGGVSFRALAGGRQVLAVLFDLDGQQLWYGSFAGQPALDRTGWGLRASM